MPPPFKPGEGYSAGTLPASFYFTPDSFSPMSEAEKARIRAHTASPEYKKWERDIDEQLRNAVIRP